MRPGFFRLVAPPPRSLTTGADSAGDDMTVTVGQRIEAQGTGLVGRESERAFLHLVLGEEGPLVVFIHGIGGVGKSSPRRGVRAEARRSRRDHPAARLRRDRAHAARLPRGALERRPAAT